MTHVTDFLAKRAELSPDKVALIEWPSGAETTYSDWNERANRTARFLAELGVEAGDRVAVYSSNHVEFLDLILAAPKIGAVLVNLNWRLTVPELIEFTANADPKVLIYSPDWADNAHQLAEQLDLQIVVAIERPADGEVDFADRLASSADPVRWLDLELDHPWGIFPTGGTTGLPKGAVLTHGNVTWNSTNTIVSWGLHAGHSAALELPLFHIGGPFIFMLPLIHAGGTTVFCTNGFDPDQTLDLVDSGRITHYVGVPTMYQVLQSHPRWERTDFSKLELVISGGAPCPAPIMEEFWRRSVDFKTGYGLTEASGNCFWLPPDQVRAKPGSVGYPLFHNRCRIVDEDGNDVEQGTPGELLMEGPHIFAGYWNRPEATAEALADGWLHTGDIATQDEDGAFRIIGRSKEMYISGGENVYPSEVESVLAAHPAIDEAAVVGIPDEKWGEVGAAFVTLHAGHVLEEGELISFAGERLARYKLPRRVVVLDELPLTAIGKHDKKLMAARFGDTT